MVIKSKTRDVIGGLEIVPAKGSPQWCGGYGLMKTFVKGGITHMVFGLWDTQFHEGHSRPIAIQHDGTSTTVTFAMDVRFSPDQVDPVGSYLLRAGVVVQYEREGREDLDKHDRTFVIKATNDGVGGDVENNLDMISGAFHVNIYRMKKRPPVPTFGGVDEVDGANNISTVDLRLGGPSSQRLRFNYDFVTDDRYAEVKVVLIPVLIRDRNTLLD